MTSANIKFSMVFIYKEEHLICRAEIADSFFERARGLMFKKRLKNKEGLLIKFSAKLKSRTIHSLFMRFPIDLIFIDENHCITEVTTLYPWSFYKPKIRSSKMVLEVNAGTINSLGLTTGDKLRFVR